MRDFAEFRISSFCSNGTCVGVAETPEGVEVAALSDSTVEPLHLTREEWTAFVAGVKAGEFDFE